MLVQKYTAGFQGKISALKAANPIKTSFRAENYSEDNFVPPPPPPGDGVLKAFSDKSEDVRDFHTGLKWLCQNPEARVFRQNNENSIRHNKIILGIPTILRAIHDDGERYKAFNYTLETFQFIKAYDRESDTDHMFMLGICGLAKSIPALAPENQDKAFNDIYNNISCESPLANYARGYLEEAKQNLAKNS